MATKRKGRKPARKHRGARDELIASAWLLEQGYDVFRNVSQHGLADFIVSDFRTGQIILIDVKACTRQGPKGRISLPKPKAAQVAAGIRMLYVLEGGKCGWHDQFAAENETKPRWGARPPKKATKKAGSEKTASETQLWLM